MRARSLVTGLALLVAGIAPVLSHAGGATDVAGIPAADVGTHGPTQDVANNLSLVGHADMRPDDPITHEPAPTTKPLGNNGGIALIGDCAYVGRWHDYGGKNHIQIVDVDRDSPTFMHDVGSIAGSSISGAVSREIRAIDLPGFKMLTVLVFAQATGDRTHNMLNFYSIDAEDCTKATLAGTFDMKAFRGHEFYQWLDPNPAHNVNGHPRILEYVTTPIGPGNIIVVDASTPASPMLIGVYEDVQPVASPTEIAGTGLGTYAHSISISADGTEAYISDWDGGFFTLDSTACTLGVPACALVPKGLMSLPLHYGIDPDSGLPAWGNTHSAVPIPGTTKLVVGDEIYASTDACPFGWMRIIDKGSAIAPAQQVAEFRLPENHLSNCGPLEGGLAPQLGDDDPTRTRPVKDRNANGVVVDGTFSMHNQTVTKDFAFVSWYGGGIRVVDLRGGAPAEAGMFVPKPVETIKSAPDTSAPVYGADTIADNDWWVATWSYPIIRDGLIYVCDMRSGLYVLAPTEGAPFAETVRTTKFLEGNSNFGALVP